jgi:RNA polymerase sigma-70 factor (ECF subfamily)
MSALPVRAAINAHRDELTFRFEQAGNRVADVNDEELPAAAERARLAIDDSARIATLLVATAAGDDRAFAELYDRTSPRVFGLMLRMLRRPELAQEAMQECYVRVWRHADTYCPERGEPQAWLIGVARHRALDLLRARALRTDGHEVGDAALAGLADSAIGPELSAMAGDDASRLNRCLQLLRPELRHSLQLAYYRGLSHSELAHALGAPLGTVKAWVRRGLQQLRSCLRE